MSFSDNDDDSDDGGAFVRGRKNVTTVAVAHTAPKTGMQRERETEMEDEEERVRNL